MRKECECDRREKERKGEREGAKKQGGAKAISSEKEGW